ncbi:MAG: hypothetical protein FWH41_10765 [Treponema sp.]|nr:hypothetical protein [Treponema sp.]
MDFKKSFDRFENENIFIKTTIPSKIDGGKKSALNRKGNELFNSGKIEEARRIFMTTGYSDGLSRVGDYYKSKNRLIEALRMYWIAPDRSKCNPMIMQLAEIVKDIIKEKSEEQDE